MEGTTQPTVWFNAGCSTCRRLRALLDERGIAAHYRHYLDDPPSREEIAVVMERIGASRATELVRWKDPLAGELGLEGAGPEAVRDALARHPALIARPVVITADRAVVARPPERALELLGGVEPAG